MGTVIAESTPGEALLATGTPGTTDHTFKAMRGLTQRFAKGVEGLTDLKVTQRGAGANMSVDVATGYAWVPGATQGPTGEFLYGCPNPATVNLAGITAPVGATRRDMVVARAYDEGGDTSGTGRLSTWYLQYIKNIAEVAVAEALPSNALLLATLDVTVGAGSITNAMITDQRTWGGPAIVGLDGKLYTVRVGTSGELIMRNVTDAVDANQQPRAKVRLNADQAIATSVLTTFTTVSWNGTDAWDTAAMHDPASNASRLIAPVAGTYEIEACLVFAAAATGWRRAAIFSNGGTTMHDVDSRPAVDAGSYVPLRVKTQLELAAAEYAEIKVAQNSGGSVNLTGGAFTTTPVSWATMRRIDKGA